MFLKDAIEIRINNLCNQQNITINKLCTICGITQSTLANLKVRPNTNVSTLTILRICRGLNITLEDFFMIHFFQIMNLKMIKKQLLYLRINVIVFLFYYFLFFY